MSSESSEKPLWTVVKKPAEQAEGKPTALTEQEQQEVQQIQQHVVKTLQPAVDRQLSLLLESLDQVFDASARAVKLLYPSPSVTGGRLSCCH